MTKRKVEYILHKIIGARAAFNKACFEQRQKTKKCKSCLFSVGDYCNAPDDLEEIEKRFKEWLGIKA